MQPIKFEEATRVLGAGDNPNTGDMWVVTALDPETKGVGIIVSCWEPTEAEFEEFVKNKKLYIGVMCNLQQPTQPPICATPLNPFIHSGYRAIQHRNGIERMFEGKPDITELMFTDDDKHYAMNVTVGEGSFSLTGVVEMKEDGISEPYGPATKIYFKAYTILAENYTEI